MFNIFKLLYLFSKVLVHSQITQWNKCQPYLSKIILREVIFISVYMLWEEETKYLSLSIIHDSAWMQLMQLTLTNVKSVLFFLWRCDPKRVMASSFLMFLDHTQRRTTVGRTLLDDWSARRRDLYLTTHNTHNRHSCPRWDSSPRSQQASGRRSTP